jgi:hypothetical protein
MIKADGKWRAKHDRKRRDQALGDDASAHLLEPSSVNARTVASGRGDDASADPARAGDPAMPQCLLTAVLHLPGPVLAATAWALPA